MSESFEEGVKRAQNLPDFKYPDPIQVEVVSFGTLGASVEVVGIGHNPDDLIAESAASLGRGLISQQEISYFRQSRGNIDVVTGELLPAYVEKVREVDGKLAVVLRKPGGKAKAQDLAAAIMEVLEETGGTLNVGDKSSVQDIQTEFPGASKTSFKKAVSSLFKKGLVKPGPHSITRM